MEIKDKRLVNKLTKHEQAAYEEDIATDMPDAENLFEEITIDHEPIELLERITSKKNIEKQVSLNPEPTDNDNG